MFLVTKYKEPAAFRNVFRNLYPVYPSFLLLISYKIKKKKQGAADVQYLSDLVFSVC